ncbi:alpha-L-rhamnosidase [Butyrivibrio sp. YAB3001]|uniref:alpha-L-rhamnosidase n=1 Tax=Butyrivibrio sp. YAB3001 TaxID=1520812 RepID=UPI0008F6326B|nr:alpha-L-rhamnosidase [Butyrivibrio sp. YAB3001]SFB87289.1 alpha-L-rhamnosidase [Butyrivibrio sp. YAB3001]
MKSINDNNLFALKTIPVIVSLFGTLALSGCASGANDVTTTSDQDKNASIPLIDEYDAEMKSAHFISAPVIDKNDIDKEISEYEASYNMLVGSNEAYFVLGDETGEYGRLILFGLRTSSDGDKFIFKSFNNGTEDKVFYKEILLQSASDAENVFEVNIKVTGEQAEVGINGEYVGAIDIPKFSLGCVGTYNNRGVDVAHIDDISVKCKEQVLFEDDFDGNFANNLFDYDYAGTAESAFSPYYVKLDYDTKGKSLIVPSGFIISETKKDCAKTFRKEFDADKGKIESAYLYMTAFGSFDITLNGQKVSENFFEPGKMVFDQYLNYVSYDVTDFLEKNNTLSIELFHGFFDRGVGYPETATPWGKRLAVKGELVINYKDGSREIIPTDDSFKVSSESRYRSDDIYQGEMIDDRIGAEESGDWTDVAVDDVQEHLLNLPIYKKENESIACTEKLKALSVSEPVPGHFVYDFGQNIAGTISVDFGKLKDNSAAEGEVVTFRYGELLNSEQMVNSDDEPGTVWTQNLLTARNTDYYVFGKEKDKKVTFLHTYHGFRYVEITGLSNALDADALEALVLSSDLQETGDFKCSDEIINKYYSNSVYSLKSNLMDVPTDCCQRDERLGWTGDAQLTSLFAMYKYDAESFYRNYLKEIRAMQGNDGLISDVAPARDLFGGHSCWGDCIITIPWNLYLQYGDDSVIRENIDAATKWLDYLVSNSEDFLFTSGGYGDHLSMQNTPETLSDTAWCAHSARILAKMYKTIGDKENFDKYNNIADSFTDSWQKTFIRSDASLEGGILIDGAETETAYSLGISFELFPNELMDAAAGRLKLLTEYGGYIFYPGYSGLSFYLPALSANGYIDDAVEAMTNTSSGGLAHPVTLGLTTNPEEIGAFKYNDFEGNEYPDGRYYVSGSLNHAAYSSVATFCFTDILGIVPDEEMPGYKHFYIQPKIGSMLTSAEGSFISRYGKISVSWNLDEKQLSCTIPDESTCTLILPNGESHELSSGEYIYSLD